MNKPQPRRDNENDDFAFYTSGFRKMLNLFLSARTPRR